MSSGGWSDPDEENWDDNGWEAPRHGRVFAIPGHLLGEPVPPTQNHASPPPVEVIPPDPEFGGEWRPLPVCGRAKGASNGSANNGSASNSTTCRYPPPRRPRQDDFVNFGLNKRWTGTENRVFVSSLPFNYFEADLERVFSAFGPLKSCQVIRERFVKPGDLRRRGQYRSRGYGFVEFEDAEGWKAALKATEEELTWEGRVIKVCEARDNVRGDKNGLDIVGLDDTDAAATENFDGLADDVVAATTHNIACATDDLGTAATQNCAAAAGDDVDISLSGALAAASLSTLDLSPPPIDASSSSPPARDLSFARLPDSVVVKIFGYLTLSEKAEAELVSKRWRTLSRSSWGSLTEFIVPKYRGIYKFGSCLTDMKFMTVLTLMRNSWSKKCNLRKLDISGCNLGYHGLKSIGENCPYLEHLDLSGNCVLRDSLRIIANGCRQLRVFVIRSSHDLREKTLWYVLKDCHFLERLDVRECSRIKGDLFFLANERLVSVNLERCGKFKDSGLGHIVTKCPALKELNISNCKELTPAGISKISSLSCLESLTMRQMNFPAETRIIDTAIRASTLRVLDLGENRCITPSCLDILYSRCAQLERLNLYCCYTLNGMSFPRLFASLPRLKYLNLCYVEVDFTDDAGYLDVFHNRRSVEEEAFCGCLFSLEEALFIAIPNFDDTHMDLLLQFPSLTLLNVSGNFNVSCASLYHYPKENAQLKQLVEGQRRERKLKVRLGGTGITRESVVDLGDVIEPFYDLDFIDASITSLRLDAPLVPVDWGSDDDDDYIGYDYDDYEDDDSFGVGGDLEDFDHNDPMEEFERNWIS